MGVGSSLGGFPPYPHVFHWLYGFGAFNIFGAAGPRVSSTPTGTLISCCDLFMAVGGIRVWAGSIVGGPPTPLINGGC